jgi:PPOX class probable F420-dependent enzyme
VPVWIGVDGDQIVFLTDPTSRKARNLEHDPRVAISITDHDQPFAMAAVRGRVTERLEDDAAFAIIDRLSLKYTGQPYPLRTDRVLFRIGPENAWGRVFG